MNIKKYLLVLIISLITILNLFAPPKFLTVRVSSNPSGAYFSVSGSEKIGPTPINHKFREGSTYIVDFFQNGKKVKTITYTCDGSPINVTLQPISKTLTVNSNINGANVIINGQQYGQTPLTTSLNPGSYNVQVTYPGYKTYNISVNLNSDQTIYANLEPNIAIKIWINGNEKQINFGKKKNKKQWKTFTFYSTQKKNTVKVKYKALVVEKNIKFENQTISLQAVLR